MNAEGKNNLSVVSDVPTILYVDDKPANLNSLTSLFDGTINILTASSGKEALEILKEHTAQVIIADQIMHDMTGVEFLKKVKDKGTCRKYILLTGYHDNELIKDVDNDVVIHWYMNKPFDKEKIEHIIKKAIEAIKSDELLRESEEKFRGAFESMIDVFTRTDMEGKCVMVSPSIYNLLGYTEEEVLGRNLADFYKDPSQRKELLKKLMELGSVEHFEFRAGRKDGTTIIVSANAKIVYNSEGEPMWVEGNIRDTSEIKEVSNALSESENRFRATFEQAAIGIAHVSTEGRFLRINEKFCDIIGYSHDEMLGLTFQDITHPEDLGNDLKDVQGVINGEKESFSKEKRYIRKSGEIMWGHLTVSIVRNNIGESQWFVAVVKDINEQKLAEMALRQNRDLLKHLVSAMPDAVFHIKMPVRTINWTDDSFDVMGYEPEEYIGQSTEKYYANPEDYTKVGRLQQEAISRGDDMISTEIMARRKDGKVFPAELTATFYKEEGKISQITAFVRDISKRKQAEEKLLESEEKFKTLVTKTEEIIFIIAKDGTFLLSEGKGLDKLGLKPGEVVGISVFDLYKDFPTLLDKIRQAFSGETVIMEHEVGDFYFKSWYTPHLNQNGEIIGLLGLAVNITEQKIAENKIMGYQNRLKALANELILSEEKQRRQIATDLHDHVGQILASSRLQIAALNNSMEKEDILKKLKSISGGINDTIKATQDAIFELSPPQLNQIGLAAALSDWMHKELKTKHGIKCELLGDAKKYPVNNVMRYLLFRCACELLVNVVKHARASKVKVNVQNKNDNITVSVQDNGSGFNYNPKLLKMKQYGFGLLSIYERIENIGGTLQIDTAPGKGTKVVLKVPVNN